MCDVHGCEQKLQSIATRLLYHIVIQQHQDNIVSTNLQQRLLNIITSIPGISCLFLVVLYNLQLTSMFLCPNSAALYWLLRYKHTNLSTTCNRRTFSSLADLSTEGTAALHGSECTLQQLPRHGRAGGCGQQCQTSRASSAQAPELRTPVLQAHRKGPLKFHIQ